MAKTIHFTGLASADVAVSAANHWFGQGNRAANVDITFTRRDGPHAAEHTHIDVVVADRGEAGIGEIVKISGPEPFSSNKLADYLRGTGDDVLDVVSIPTVKGTRYTKAQDSHYVLLARRGD